MRSQKMTFGLEKAPHRSLLYALGLTREEMKRPLIGVVNAANEVVPGHLHLGKIAESVKAGIRMAGGTPMEFPAIAVCDGLAMNHEGMRFSLTSREVITDSIEIMATAHPFDALVFIPNCDKIVPGMLMAAMRLNIPAIVVPGGPMLPGKYQDMEAITLTDMRELIGRTQTGRLTEDELMKIEEAALPGVGTCAMLGTANTMSCLAEALGMSLPGCGLAHAVSAKKRRIAKQSGRRIVAMVKEDLTPRKIMTREALRNAIRVSMAMGASTNSTLHLPAIAHEAGIHITLDDFDELSREIPYLCNIKPSGQYPLSVLEEQGGVPAVMKALERKLDLEQMTVSGKTVGENLAGVELVENDVIFSLDHPKKPEGGLAILHGNLAPKGAVVKRAGVKPRLHYFEGQARVLTSMEEARWAVSNDKIPQGDVLVIRYEGHKGGPGMREMHMTCHLIVGRGMDEDCALVTDGRFSGSTRGPCIGHVSPDAAAGGPIAAVEEGDRIIIDIPNRTLTLCVTEEELQRRLARVRHIHKPATPALERYAALVTSAEQGAVPQLPRER
mgnify:CR=1 FL=1